jgi:hypothetical protein
MKKNTTLLLFLLTATFGLVTGSSRAAPSISVDESLQDQANPLVKFAARACRFRLRFVPVTSY